MKSLLLLITLIIGVQLSAQMPGDSIWVSAFDYSMTYGAGDRDTVCAFPSDPNLTFEKVLMFYNMRCKGGLVSSGSNRNLGCGEWDYSCNTYLVDSSRADSLIRTTTNYTISNFNGTTFNWNPNPLNDYYYNLYKKTTLSSVISETSYPFSQVNVNLNTAFPLQHYNSRSQYLYLASELNTAGMTAGNIDGFFLFPINTISADFVRIRMKNSSKTALTSDSLDESGWTEVYFDELNAYALPSGQRLLFHTPFSWNGTDNVMLEISYYNQTGNGGFTIPQIQGHATSYQSSVYSSGEQYPLFQGSNAVNIIGNKGVPGTQVRSMEAWIKTTKVGGEIICWGRNVTSQKWLMRVNGGGELRIEAAGGANIGTTQIADGKWHHVAVVMKAASLSNVDLYVDGQKETLTSSSSLAINTAQDMDIRIGHGLNNNFFEGNIDNVRIWNTDISASTIKSWKNRKIDNSHPNYSNLVLDLSKDSLQNNQWIDNSPNANNGTATSIMYFQREQGDKIIKNLQGGSTRPDLLFFRGQYNASTVLDTAWLAMPQTPHLVTKNNIIDRSGTIMSDEVNKDSISFRWNADNGYRYYDSTGTLIRSTTAVPYGTITITDTDYWERHPMTFEIMSFVTPYGINLNLGPNGKTWIFDLTDFSPIMRGNKRITMNKGGQWQEDMDIKFLFIVGTPPSPVLDITNLWYSDRSSTNANIRSNAVFPPRSLSRLSGVEKMKVRSSITGHGQQGEFIPRQHFLSVNNSQVANWQVWKKCGDNPIYPQGGTWIYDRAGWCPGAATHLEETDITSAVGTAANFQIDYDMANATGDSRYIVSHELVSYGPISHSLDARIEDILYPTTRVEYSRDNPSCKKPTIILQNVGSTALTSATIQYKVNNGTAKTYKWTGNLAYMEKTEVELPSDDQFWSGITATKGNVFYAEILQANNKNDDYALNDKISSEFDVPLIFPSKVAITIRTNNAPAETRYQIIDLDGNMVYDKQYTTASKTFNDTVDLPPTCHTFQMLDADGDGISFWANNDGNGYVLLTNAATGQVLTPIQGDFGSEFKLDFTVAWPLSYEQLHGLWEVQIYPNPTRNELNINAQNIEKAQWSLWYSLGKKVDLEHKTSTGILHLNTADLSPGIYFFQAIYGDKIINKSFIKE